MSTLEELKRQASEATQRNQVANAAAPDEQQQWRKLAPVMKYLKSHFTELANTLNVLEKDILVDFAINDAVTLKRVKAQNYKVTHPSADKEKILFLHKNNVFVLYKKKSVLLYKKQNMFLNKNHMFFTRIRRSYSSCTRRSFCFCTGQKTCVLCKNKLFSRAR